MDSLAGIVSKVPKEYVLVATSALAGATVIGCGWVLVDYNSWVAFGTGGTPPTPAGYWKITKFRILRALSGDDLKDASKLPSDGPSYITSDLPQRQPPPPKVLSRTLPQRQVPALLDRKVSQRLHKLIPDYAAKYSDLLTLDSSITEGRTTDAIYARNNLPGRKKGAHDPVLGDEIAHVHPQDNSLHVWLSLADTKKVVSAGWGQRFPLASLKMVHGGWTLLYAPRSDAEVDVIEEIVKAGIRHLTGEQIS